MAFGKRRVRCHHLEDAGGQRGVGDLGDQGVGGGLAPLSHHHHLQAGQVGFRGIEQAGQRPAGMGGGTTGGLEGLFRMPAPFDLSRLVGKP